MVRQQKKPAGLGVLPPGGSGLALNRKGKEKKNSAYPARTHMVDARLEKRQEVKMKRNWDMSPSGSLYVPRNAAGKNKQSKKPPVPACPPNASRPRK
jgi:hypothetical protein